MTAQGVTASARAAASPRLVAVLLLLTVLTGVVDAVSYLGLGRVFVANMTGNVVFLGFGLAGADGLSAPAALAALAAFALGGLVGGRMAGALERRRRRWLLTVLGAHLVLLVAATAAAAAAGPVSAEAATGSTQYALIVVLALAMGLQNATVRRLAVPDLTTTVLTLTVTGLAADSRPAGGSSPRTARRVGSVVLMLLGALLGGVVVLQAGLVVALAVAAAVSVAAIAVAASLPAAREVGAR